METLLVYFPLQTGKLGGLALKAMCTCLCEPKTIFLCEPMCVSLCECEKALHIFLCKSLLIYPCAFSPFESVCIFSRAPVCIYVSNTHLKHCTSSHVNPTDVFPFEPMCLLSLWTCVPLSVWVCTGLCGPIRVSEQGHVCSLANPCSVSRAHTLCS